MLFALGESWKHVPKILVKKSWCQILSSKNMDEWDTEDSILLSESQGELGEDLDLVELVNRLNRADDTINKPEVGKWARLDVEENLDREI